jgi:hypothetical protein
VAVVAVVAVLAVAGCERSGCCPVAGPPTGDPAWAALDAQSRCDRARELVAHPDRWPVVCRWRAPGEALQAQSFPPPRGPAPYDDPHVEIYVERAQGPEELANAIAHELGHMHHTREFRPLAEWLEARGLPAGTADSVWTEDYAEVFAALFSPPATRWRAPTPRPDSRALAELKARFFA